MHGLGLNPESSHRKCARVVGEVLGKYHPHGEMGGRKRGDSDGHLLLRTRAGFLPSALPGLVFVWGGGGSASSFSRENQLSV